MNDKTDISVYEAVPRSTDVMDVTAVKQHVSLIHTVMRDVMKEGMDRHYGTIPGTPKPSLLQPGAQLIGMMFRLAPTYDVDKDDLGDGHREYSVTCTLSHMTTGQVVGQGIGSANTLEGKWRYRWDSTGQTVPSDYWKTRDAAILGGPQYVPRKKDGKWMIFQRIAHDNPADNFNTVLKIAKKRAFVDAIQTSTAASDIFTSDIEDYEHAVSAEPPQEPTPETPKPRRRKKNTDTPPTPSNGAPAPSEIQPPELGIRAAIDAASNLDDLTVILADINELPSNTEKKTAHHYWQARKDELGV